MKPFVWGLPWFRSAMVRPSGRYQPLPVGRVVVLEHGRNPSTDIYLKPRLAAPGTPPVDYIDIASRTPESLELGAQGGTGTLVVVCRYISEPWLRRLASAAEQLAGVAYFTDDDLPAAAQDPSLPRRYRRKIWRLYGQHVAGLSAITSQLWVSTEALAAKYAGHGAEILTPSFIGPAAGASKTLRWFYHGTAAHEREMRWLVEVVAEVQRRRSDALFEIFGGWKVRRLYRGIERVVVLAPLSWPDYLAYTSATPQSIGLAPLLPSAVNSARSPTKFFDIARVGAAGLFTAIPPFAGFVRDGVDGLLLPNRPERWTEEVLALADDERRRRSLAEAALARCRKQADSIDPLPGTRRAAARRVAAKPAHVGSA